MKVGVLGYGEIGHAIAAMYEKYCDIDNEVVDLLWFLNSVEISSGSSSYLFSEGSNPFVINFVRCCFTQEKLNLKTYLIEKELNF